MTNIHPMAYVEKGAQIASTAEIGPFCTVSKNAVIGEGVRLLASVHVMGRTTIGDNTVVFPGAVLGAGPQDRGNEFCDGALIVGKNNIIKENVTMQVGTPKERLLTVVGDNSLFMVNCHIAHDCVVGNGVILANNAIMGGHVHIGDGAVLGGNCGIHQFVHIGKKAMIGGLTGVARDVIPYGMVTGDRASLRGLNVVGLQRMGVDEATIKRMMRAYMFLFKGKEGTFEERLADAHEKYKDEPMVMEQIKFIDESLGGRRNLLVAD